MENVSSKEDYIQSAKWFRNFVSKNDSKKFNFTYANVSKSQTLTRLNQKCSNNDLQLNFNCHANSLPSAPCSSQPGCMVIPDQKERFLVNKQNHINYTKELLQQIEEVKEKKIKERDLEKEREQSVSDDNVNGTRLCECSDALLTDIYGHVLVRRHKDMSKHDNISTDASPNNAEKYPEELQVSSENFMNSLKKNLSAQSHQAIQESLSKQQNTSQLATATSCLVSNFHRGGHGIFGEPISELEKQKRLKYQQELLEQINIKREKEKLERGEKIKEDEEMKKRLEEYMQRQKKKEKEEQKKINENIEDQNHNALLNYKNELLNQIQMKKESEIETKKRNIAEDLELLKQNEEKESHTILANVPEGDLRRKKFDNELTRKPRQSVEEYQQELLQQIREKRAMEALQRQAEEVEEKELLKINEEKIARLIIENQLIQPKLKHFEAKQQIKEQIEVNKKYQEFLLKQMKQREAQLLIDKRRELESEARRQEEEIKYKIMKFCSGDYAPVPHERSSTRCCSDAEQRTSSSATVDDRSHQETLTDFEGKCIISSEIRGNEPKEKLRKKVRRGKEVEGCGDAKNDDEFYEMIQKAQQEQKIMYSKDLLQQIENKKKESDKEKENERIEEEKMRKINRDRERRRIMEERRNRKKLDKITNDQHCLQCISHSEKSAPVATVRKSVQKKFWKTLVKNCKGKFENGFYLQEKSSKSSLLDCQNAPGFWALFNRGSAQKLKNKNTPAENVEKCIVPNEEVS